MSIKYYESWLTWGSLFSFFPYLAYIGYETSSLIVCNTAISASLSLCSANAMIVVVQSAVNVVTDFYVLALPIPFILRLHLRVRQRIGLACIFLAGSV